MAPARLLWDDARTFISGQSGQFAFRVVAECDIERLGVAATAGGTDLPPVVFYGLHAGESREGTMPFMPVRVGSVSVALAVETKLPSRAREVFSAGRSPEHAVLSPERLDVRGAGSLTINVQNNTGIVRNDDMKVASALRGARVDRWDEQRQVLGRRGAFVPVGLSSVSVDRETVHLRCGARDVAIAAGSGSVSFGDSSRRASVPLCGLAGPRSCYVSGTHFSMRRDPLSRSIVLRDGAPDASSPRSAGGSTQWRSSTNGTCVDGVPVAGAGVALPPGRSCEVSLAPYAVPGGAMNLLLDSSAAPAWLSASLPGDAGEPSPARPFAVVVWDDVPLAAVLGPEARGLRVSVVDGRLVLSGDGVAPVRLDFLSGRPLPRCPGWSVA